jgi:hypothetical protein
MAERERRGPTEEIYKDRRRRPLKGRRRGYIDNWDKKRGYGMRDFQLRAENARLITIALNTRYEVLCASCYSTGINS